MDAQARRREVTDNAVIAANQPAQFIGVVYLGELLHELDHHHYPGVYPDHIGEVARAFTEQGQVESQYEQCKKAIPDMRLGILIEGA